MKSSRIYNKVRTDRPSDRSFGCGSWFRQTVCVGASRVNSFEALTIGVDSYDEGNERTFQVFIGSNVVKVIRYNTKTTKFDVIKDTLTEV
jgi:hypothetical protein